MTDPTGLAAAPRPVVTRAQWGARPPKTPPVPMPANPVGNLYHHTTGATLAPDQQGPDYYPAWVRSVQNYHMDHNGWNDIGYNFLVDPHGTIYEGRGWHVVGAHAGVNTSGGSCPCTNSNSHGVAFLGDSNQPGVLTLEAEESLRWLLDQAAAQWGPQGHWGHRDVHPTDCPGDPLYAFEKGGLEVGPPPMPEPPPIPPNPAPQPAPPDDWSQQIVDNLPTVSYGTNGQQVRNIQGLLVARGYLPGPGSIDGAYGPNTEAAVKRFQQNYSVAGGADGVVGRNTWTALLTV